MEQPRQAVPAQFEEIMVDEYQDTNEIQDRIFGAVSGGGARLFPGAGYGTASAHPSASTVETAPAVSACQSSSPPARFSSVPVFQAPRIPT